MAVVNGKRRFFRKSRARGKREGDFDGINGIGAKLTEFFGKAGPNFQFPFMSFMFLMSKISFFSNPVNLVNPV
jgi:hypothetical protein